MATLTIYEVTARDDGWAVEREGAGRPTAVEARKRDAVERAREIAHRQEPSKVVVYKQDGTVQTSYTYGEVTTGDGPVAEGRGAAGEAAYALVGLATDALQLANEAMELARSLPSRAQDRREQVRGLTARREELEETIRGIRRSAETHLDEKADRGRDVAQRITGDDRVRRVVDQAETARSQIKAAITSIRRTGSGALGSAVEAGRNRADVARSQTKAAATSVQRTAESAVDAGKDVTRRR